MVQVLIGITNHVKNCYLYKIQRNLLVNMKTSKSCFILSPLSLPVKSAFKYNYLEAYDSYLFCAGYM